jgi:hypothetical protein
MIKPPLILLFSLQVKLIYRQKIIYSSFHIWILSYPETKFLFPAADKFQNIPAMPPPVKYICQIIGARREYQIKHLS